MNDVWFLHSQKGNFRSLSYRQLDRYRRKRAFLRNTKDRQYQLKSKSIFSPKQNYSSLFVMSKIIIHKSRNFYGTEIQIWDGFVLVGMTEKKDWANYGQLFLRAFFNVFISKKSKGWVKKSTLTFLKSWGNFLGQSTSKC